MKTTKLFTVYMNDEKLPHLVNATLRDAKMFIRGYVVSTHMGQWRKINGGYEYATTIGRYYKFIRGDS